MKSVPAISGESLDVEFAQPVDAGWAAEQELDVRVLFTDEKHTAAALLAAAELAASIKARLSLVVLQVVPRPLPPECSPVPIAFLEERARRLAARIEEEVSVNVFLCRNKKHALESAFAGSDVVVIGLRRRWWRGEDARLGERLERLGCKVLYVEKQTTGIRHAAESVRC